MSVTPKTLLLASSFAITVAAPGFLAVGDARAQAPGVQGNAVTPFPACNSKPTEDDSKAAHSAYLLGKRFFEESDYGSASHNFVDAYKLDCTKPELLLNIARANELLGNKAAAIYALETYMQRAQALSPDEKAQLQRRIDNLKAAMAAAVAVVPVAPAPAPTPSAAPAPPPAPPPPPPAPAPEERHHTIAPWIVAGAGGAAVVAGAAVFLVGAGDVSTAKGACPSGACSGPNAAASASKGNTGDTLEKAGAATFYVGLAAVAGGLLWHFLEPTGPAKTGSTTITPVIGPGFAAAGVAGRF